MQIREVDPVVATYGLNSCEEAGPGLGSRARGPLYKEGFIDLSGDFRLVLRIQLGRRSTFRVVKSWRTNLRYLLSSSTAELFRATRRFLWT